jgi:transcriptional regulator with XRE-family HTH domain
MPQPTKVTETIAANVRRLRRRDNLSARALGERCNAAGVDFGRDAVASLENKRRQHVTVDQLLALANALETTPLALLGELDEDPLTSVDTKAITAIDPDVQAALDDAVDRAREAGLSLREVLDYVRMTDAMRQHLAQRGYPPDWRAGALRGAPLRPVKPKGR